MMSPAPLDLTRFQYLAVPGGVREPDHLHAKLDSHEVLSLVHLYCMLKHVAFCAQVVVVTEVFPSSFEY